MSDPVVEYVVGATPEDTFAVPFQYWKKEDIEVKVGGIPTTAFTITGEPDNSTSSIVLATPAQNTTVRIQRETVLDRLTVFPIAGPFRIEALNSEFDRVIAMIVDMDYVFENIKDILDDEYVEVLGDTMLGPLLLAGNPTQDLEAVTKIYVDNENAAQNVNIAGNDAKNVQQDGRLDGLDTEQLAQNDRLTNLEDKDIVHDTRLDDLDAEQVVQDDKISTNAANIDLRARWQGTWVDQQYEANDMVNDWPYLMVANKQTTDRAAPQDIGNPVDVYQGNNPTAVVDTARTLLVQNTYTVPEALRITQVRAYVITGNYYSLYVRDDSTGQVTEIANFVASETKWRAFATAGSIISAGTAFTVGLFVAEPDPTPTEYVLSYNYTTPNNTGVPAAGTIIHANRAAAEFRVNKTGQGGQDNSAALANMETGDIIDDGDIRWAIQSITDNGTWINFGVAPTTQGSAGIKDFTFETVTPTPITTVLDPDYYLGNASVQPGYSVDGGSVILTDDGYGVDITYQQVVISDDWDVMAVSEGGGAGGSEPPDVQVPYFEEVHNPDGSGYCIQGTTLTCWGSGETDSGSNYTIVTPKSYTVGPKLLATPIGDAGLTAQILSRATTGGVIRLRDTDGVGTGAGVFLDWMTVGQWDGT